MLIAVFDRDDIPRHYNFMVRLRFYLL